MIVMLVVMLISPWNQEHRVAHRFFIGQFAEAKCQTWKQLYIDTVEARNKVTAYNVNMKIGAATCINTGLTVLNAPWIKDDTAGLTPGLPGEPAY